MKLSRTVGLACRRLAPKAPATTHTYDCAMMATTETLRGVLRTSRGQPILELQSAEQRASLALDLLSLGSRAALCWSFYLALRWYSDSRCGGRLSAARACSFYSVQPWRSRLGSSRHSTTLYSLRCAAPYFWVSPARIDGPSTLYYDAPRG